MDAPVLVSSSDEEEDAKVTVERRHSLITSVIDLDNEPDTAENTVIDLTLDDEHLALNLQRQFSKDANPNFDLSVARQQSFSDRQAAVNTKAQLAAIRAARKKCKKTKNAADGGGGFAEQFFAALQAERQPRLEEERERYARWLKQQEEDEARRQREAATRDLLWEQRRALTAFLENKANGLRVHEVWSNPESYPGRKLYERFKKAWEAVPQSGLRMCFHGTSEANVAPICRDGLDPKRRAGQAMGPGEYFGGQAGISLGYCKGGRKMLVFCVLTAKDGLTANTASVVVVKKPEHQLPIAVITFDHGGGGAQHDPWAARGAGRVLGGVPAVPPGGAAAAAAVAPAEAVVNRQAAQGKWGANALRKAQRGVLNDLKRGGGAAAGRKRANPGRGGAARDDRAEEEDGGGADHDAREAPAPGGGRGAKHRRVEVDAAAGAPVEDDDEEAQLQEALRRSMEER